jgi:hypothetical protein
MTQLFSVYSKVAASGTAGLVATVIIGLLGLVHITIPATVVAAIVTLIGFVAGYLKTERHVVEILSAGKHAALPVIAALDKAAAEVGPASADGNG